MTTILEADQIRDARYWLKELDGEASLGFDSQEDWEQFVNDASKERIVRMIRKLFDGGWDAFIECISCEAFTH